MAKLELYYRPSCPYCQKVFNFMQQQKITLEHLHNIQEEANRQKLIKLGSKQQVPCLIIDGKAMYESDDIIIWLKNNFRKS